MAATVTTLTRQCEHCGVQFEPLKPEQRFCDEDCAEIHGIRKQAKSWREVPAYADAQNDDARRRMKEGEVEFWREVKAAGKGMPNPTLAQAEQALERIAARLLDKMVVLNCTDPDFDFEKVPEDLKGFIVLPGGVRVKDATEEQLLEAEKWVDAQP